MSHTEAQAAKLWCPMARLAKLGADQHPAHGSPVFNRAESPSRGAWIPTGALCLGSYCAMWCWAEPVPEVPAPDKIWPEEEDEVLLKGEPERPDDLPAAYVWVPLDPSGVDGGYWVEPQDPDAHKNALARRVGHCGLASKPEYLE